MAAWIAGQLGWTSSGRPGLSSDGAGSTLRATFASEAGKVNVEILTRELGSDPKAAPCLSVIQIQTKSQQGTEAFRLSRPSLGSPAIRVDASAFESCFLPRVIDAPELDPRAESRRLSNHRVSIRRLKRRCRLRSG